MSEPQDRLSRLEPLVGRWKLTARFDFDPPLTGTGDVAFEWLEGGAFLVQRWTADHPDAPDGIAIIGASPDGDGLVQNYYDSRGVQRVYQLSFDDGVWKLWRDDADFAQRFSGTLSADGTTIEGAWEIAEDHATWRHDFALTYTKVG